MVRPTYRRKYKILCVDGIYYPVVNYKTWPSDVFFPVTGHGVGDHYETLGFKTLGEAYQYAANIKETAQVPDISVFYVA